MGAKVSDLCIWKHIRGDLMSLENYRNNYRKYFCILMIVFCLAIVGCGTVNNEETALPPKDEIEKYDVSYITEPIQVPHDMLCGGLSSVVLFEKFLYYLSYEKEETSDYSFYPTDPAVLVRVDLDNPEDITIIPFNLKEGEIFWGIDANSETLNIITMQYDIENAGNPIDSFIYRVNPDGEILTVVSVDDAINDCRYYWYPDFKTDLAGNSYIAIANDIFVVDPQGQLICKITCGSFINGLYKIDDRVYVCYLMEPVDPVGPRYLAEINTEKGELDLENEIIINCAIIGFGADTEESFFLANLCGVHIYNINDESLTTSFEWNLINLPAYDRCRAIPLEDGRILLVSKPEYDYGTSPEIPTTFSLIRPMTAEDIAAIEAAKEERARLRAEEIAKILTENPDAIIPEGIGNITLGAAGGYLDTTFKDAIFAFNLRNPDSRIEVKEYGNHYFGRDDYDDGFFDLNFDIISGNSPDILLIPNYMALGLYAHKGILQDLNPYFQSDLDLDIADYQENIIKAHEIDEKLYAMPSSFIILAMAGRAADLEGKKEWNFDEFVSFVDRFPESSIFEQPTKSSVFNICLTANGENLIDWSDEGSGFDREFFIKILEFVKRFADDDNYADERMLNERIFDGDIRLMNYYSSVAGTQRFLEMFGEPVSYIGLPSEQGSGALISAGALVAISNTCQYNQTAWDFIKHLLSDEFQSNELLPGYPVKKNAMAERIEKEKKPRGSEGIRYEDGLEFYFEYRDVTDEELEAFYDLINRADKVRVYDREVAKIINEEAGAYFNGSKSLTEVADIVENRVQLYVWEQK